MRIKLQRQWNTSDTQQLKDKRRRHKVILALTARSYEDMYPRKVHAVEEKEKNIPQGPPRHQSCNTISDEEADLSGSAKFTVFPFPFSGFIFEPALELLSWVSAECLFW